MKVLVTGAAGYIGSFMTKQLLDNGESVVVVDSLERGFRDRIDERALFKNISLQDQKSIDVLLSEQKPDAIIHFAGYISMAESMKDPILYFENNTHATLLLLELMRKNNINNIIFSSTAGVYGNPTIIPIPEDHTTNPENPYGESKLMVEKILCWYNKIYNINFASLRYFNAAGAALDGSLGEAHNPETHIIPNAILAVLGNKPFTLFGTDYHTKDGTCVRDYIHVLDLVEAHVLALQQITTHPGGYIYNVGTGNGFSNREVLDMVEKVSGKKLDIVSAPRRPGDADSLIADPTKIQTQLSFTPKYSDLETIVSSAWRWHSKNTV